jgi:hypothetical protein
MGRDHSLFTKFYMLVAGAVVLGYLAVETRGMVFSGADTKAGVAQKAGPRSSSGWGFVDGFRAGK